MNAPLDLEGFVAIVEAGSVSAAARELGVPRATLSRQLSRLEEHLGVRLISRSTRRLVTTRAGQELYQRARQIVADTREAEQAIRAMDDVPRGLLRISAPSSPTGSVAKLVADFLHQFPLVQVEVLAENRHVDLVGEGIDVALRGGVISDPNLIQRILLRGRHTAMASPSYLERAGTPQTLEDLQTHACLVGFAGGHRPHRRWPLRSGGTVEVNGVHASNDLDCLRLWCLAGLGIALVPEELLLDEVECGQLVPVLAGEVGQETALAVVYPDRAFLQPHVRAFIDFSVAFFQDFGLRIPKDQAPGC